MKKIRLINTNKYTLLDDEDYGLVSRFKWYLWSQNGCSYAISHISGKSVRLHRLLLNPPKDKVVHHKNGNGLDNRRINLEVCTQWRNIYLKKGQKNNTSGYRGVYFDDSLSKNKWKSAIQVHGKLKHLGVFKSKIAAARVYNEAARKFFGKDAILNKV